MLNLLKLDLISKCANLACLATSTQRILRILTLFVRRTGQSKGYAFVEFEHRRDAEEAFYKYQDYPLDGRRLRLDWDLGYDKKMRERGGERGERGGDRGGERGRPPPQYAPREHYDRPHRGYGGHGGYGGGGYNPG